MTDLLKKLSDWRRQREVCQRGLCIDDLHTFVRLGWRHAGLPGDFLDGEHVHLICRKLQEITKAGHGRLLYNGPPRSSKSVVFGVFWPAWTWLQPSNYATLAGPWVQFLCLTHRDDLADRDARRCRALVRSDWYQGLCGGALQIRDDADTVGYFQLTVGGARRSYSLRAAVTGHDSDIIAVDDAHSVERVESAVDRDHVTFVFDEVLPSRVNHPTRNAMVVSGQRVHVHDLSGHILETAPPGEWDHVCIPGLYDPEHPYVSPEDWRSEPGEVYWPKRFSAETLNGLVRTAHGRAAQIQQLPQKRGMSVFKNADWKFAEQAPRALRLVRYWDKAATAEDAAGDPDYTAGALGGLDDQGRFWLLDMQRGRWSSHQVEQRIRFTALELDPQGTEIWLEEEPGSAGKDVTSWYQRRVLPGLPVRGDRPTGPKLVRVDPLVAAAEAGNVILLRGSWNRDFIEECETFTGDESGHDDQVVAAAGCYSKVTVSRLPILW